MNEPNKFDGFDMIMMGILLWKIGNEFVFKTQKFFWLCLEHSQQSGNEAMMLMPSKHYQIRNTEQLPHSLISCFKQNIWKASV